MLDRKSNFQEKRLKVKEVKVQSSFRNMQQNSIYAGMSKERKKIHKNWVKELAASNKRFNSIQAGL